MGAERESKVCKVGMYGGRFPPTLPAPVLLNDGLRVKNVDPGKAPEVVYIEGEDTHHPVNLHCRGEARIVHLQTGHGLRPHEAFPLFVDLGNVR